MSTEQTAPTGDPVEELQDKPELVVAEQPAPLAELDAERRAIVEQLVTEIDVSDHNSLMFFGSNLQQELTGLSDNMLEGVRTKDVGPASDSLNEMVVMLRGFGAEELNKKSGFFARLFGAAKPVAKFVQQYETVRDQIDVVIDRLEVHKTHLLTDVVSLDRLYDSSLDYFQSLENYITAGEEKLRQLDEIDIPAAEAVAEEGQEIVEAQSLRDLRSNRDDLERRVHDLRLTRQVTMQALPSIRLVQENDKGLIRKIQSTIVNTIPLWRQQLAQAITIFRSGEAAKTVEAATDLTNELLEKNADNLQQANRQVRAQMERGVFDVEVVERANQRLIETIQESISIAQEGKQKRAVAVQRLESCENDLRQVLASASGNTLAT